MTDDQADPVNRVKRHLDQLEMRLAIESVSPEQMAEISRLLAEMSTKIHDLRMRVEASDPEANP